MSNRITKTMLQNAVSAYVNTLMARGLLDGGLSYYPGSASMGYAWRLQGTSDGKSPIGIDQGVLGYTSREAYNKLHTVIRVLNDIQFRNEDF